MDQCMHMPEGLQTVEFIPSSLQEEWTYAWNCIHRFRAAAVTQEDKDRALKWILSLPQGLLHAPGRGGKDGLRQYRELTSRFVMWRRRQMAGLIEKRKRAVAEAKSKQTGRLERAQTYNDKRVTKANRLIRRGAISRARRALESKGLGDLTNPVILAQMQAKHPPRLHEIDQDVLDFLPEEELLISVDKILPKLDMNAAPGPTGF